MNVEISKVDKADKTVLRNLLEFYCYDFSEYIQIDVNAHGKFEYPYIDSYWSDADRHPYFIKVNGKYAGFILLNRDYKIIQDPTGYVVAEFFVMRRYRRKGIGKTAAQSVFELHPGTWEISQLLSNKEAVAFWHQVVHEYTQGNFTRSEVEQEGTLKQVLVFNNSRRIQTD